jgi:nicotinamide riboside transporter PnuC
MADNHDTVTGRNLVTIGLIAALFGLAMLVVDFDPGRWVVVIGLIVAAVGGATKRVPVDSA